MTSELEQKIMEQYNYFSAPRMCSLCRHVQTSSEILSGGLGTVYYCTRPEPVGRFVVYERACCDKFERNMTPVRPPDSIKRPARKPKAKETQAESIAVVPTAGEMAKEAREFF